MGKSVGAAKFWNDLFVLVFVLSARYFKFNILHTGYKIGIYIIENKSMIYFIIVIYSFILFLLIIFLNFQILGFYSLT